MCVRNFSKVDCRKWYSLLCSLAFAFILLCSLECCTFVDVQEWKRSFAAVQTVHKQVQQSGQNVMLSTAQLGQDHIAQELRDLASQLVLLDDDAGRLESLLESSLTKYEHLDRTAMALTEWLIDAESRIEQLSGIDFMASENLVARCKVSALVV